MAGVAAWGCPAPQDEAKAGRRMQYFNGRGKPGFLFFEISV
jgi:hypothetical protein